jgi:hypothetical protein
VDGGEIGADQLDAEAVKYVSLVKLDSDVQRRLPAEGGQERVRSLGLDHLGDGLRVERLEVGRVGPLGVGHDRGRVRVHQHDAIALLTEHAARLGSRVVEFASLPDPDRAGPDDQD